MKITLENTKKKEVEIRQETPMADSVIPTDEIKQITFSVYDNKPMNPEEYEKKRWVCEVRFLFETQTPDFGTELVLTQSMGEYKNHAHKQPKKWDMIDGWYKRVTQQGLRVDQENRTCVHGKLGVRGRVNPKNTQYINIAGTWVTFDYQSKNLYFFMTQPFIDANDNVDYETNHTELVLPLEEIHEDKKRRVWAYSLEV
jgi:hypothetical protein